MAVMPARREHPLALRRLREPHPLRRDQDPSYDGVLALRPGGRAPGRGVRHRPRGRRQRDLPLVRSLRRASSSSLERKRTRRRRERGGRRGRRGRAGRCDGRPRRGELPALPEPVRTRVVALASDTLGQLRPGRPAGGAASAGLVHAQARRARLAGTQIAAALERDDDFRGLVALDVRHRQPDLAGALDSGDVPPAADPVEVAALGYLLRPTGLGRPRRGGRGTTGGAERISADSRQVSDQAERLRQQARRARPRSSRRHVGGTASRLAELKLENRGLRHKLGDARQRARSAEDAAARAVTEAEDAVREASSSHGGARSGDPAGCGRAWRTSSATSPPRVGSGAASAARTPCARGCSSTPFSRPCRACVASWRCRPSRGRRPTPLRRTSPRRAAGRRPAGARSSYDDPLLLDELLALPRAHLVVDGYNVTKTAWPELSLERQRERLTERARAAGRPHGSRDDRGLRRGRHPGPAGGQPSSRACGCCSARSA